MFESALDFESKNDTQLATSVQRAAIVRVKEKWEMLSILLYSNCIYIGGTMDMLVPNLLIDRA